MIKYSEKGNLGKKDSFSNLQERLLSSQFQVTIHHGGGWSRQWELKAAGHVTSIVKSKE